MKKIETKSRKLLRKIFGSISLTAIAFTFQACYGPGDPPENKDIKITGTVKSKTTNMPIKGIKIAVNEEKNYGLSDEEGKYSFYASVLGWDNTNRLTFYATDSLHVHFTDIDGVANGYYKDTLIVLDPQIPFNIKSYLTVDVVLEEKE